MSQYSGNQTNGAFSPTYAPSGETSTPINVVSTSMEIGGELVPGYQATYANGTSKWTAQIHSDTIDLNTDKSTFTGSKGSNGNWTWKPTASTSIKSLATEYIGDNNGTINATQIRNAFYNSKGVTLQQQLSGIQTLALEAKYGKADLKKNENFINLPGNSSRFIGGSTSDIIATNEDGTVDTASQTAQMDVSSVDLTTNAAFKSTKTRKTYGNYYYPQDIQSNKQDRIIFKMKASGGRVIDPSIKTDVKPFQRKSESIQGSVTLPIQSGIKDSNMVDWGKSTMNPIQAFGAAAAMNMMDAAGTEGKSVIGEGEKALRQAGEGVKEPGVQKAISALIAGKAVQTQNLLSRATGAIANPNMELLFNAPNLRAFDFTFQMSPRDSTEAAQIKSIINFFKQGMSVKTTSTNIFLKAPNYFEIDYVTFDESGEMMMHPSLNIIKTCALLTCSVDYTPNNSYMTYGDSSRSMVSYSMNLQFSELDPLYESDYYDNLAMQDSTAPSRQIGY
tara:strand:- start:652 stop:2163 length:1512 start_codon:yes stop_codon:yes gene_type:complete